MDPSNTIIMEVQKKPVQNKPYRPPQTNASPIKGPRLLSRVTVLVYLE